MYNQKVIDGKIVVVRYSNRKLYNRKECKYVTLTDLFAMGLNNFVVLEHKTNKNITDKIALSAIVNEFKNSPNELLEIIKIQGEIK